MKKHVDNLTMSARAKRLREEIIAGCREMADVYLAVEQEYHPLEEEVQRMLDASPDCGSAS